jgi:LSD1 subclass zinc finger protein
VICDTCFASRQVLVESSEGDDRIQFECAYCRSLLRLPPVEAKTDVRCPQCQETFFLMPDGGVEARLQGSTTAILTKEEALRNLTPTAGNLIGVDGAQVLDPDARNKTQPLRTVGKAQKKILRDLTATNLDVVKELPNREVLPVSTQRKARTSKGVETEVQIEPYTGLKASEEGKLDLDLERLRSKTQRLEKNEAAARAKKAQAKRDTERREQAVRRAESAHEKGKALERTQSRRSFWAALGWAAVGVPAAVALLTLSMTVRNAGFVSRGPIGEQLQRFGTGVDQGARALNAALPEGLRATIPARGN